MPRGSQQYRQYLRSGISGGLNRRFNRLSRPTKLSTRTRTRSSRVSGKAADATNSSLHVVYCLSKIFVTIPYCC